MEKKEKITKTEIFLFVLTLLFLLTVLAITFVTPLRRGDSFTVAPQRQVTAEEDETEWQIDLNKATEEQLQKLDGIGPVLAERIVAYRQEHGDFTSVDQLLEVEGIGEGILGGIRDMLIIEEEP